MTPVRRPKGLALAGRKIPGPERDYGSDFTPAQLREALERVEYPGLDLSHLAPCFPQRVVSDQLAAWDSKSGGPFFFRWR